MKFNIDSFQKVLDKKIIKPKATAISSPSPTTKTKLDNYPLHSEIVATIFWVGENASGDNAGISNISSAWDINWQINFGGVDDPYNRNGYYPVGFVPKQNPFYFALPYNDFKSGERKANASKIYWYKNMKPGISLLKNHWVQVISGTNQCFGQWEDVGPNESDDVNYVFGSQKPINTFSKEAGIDLSPAMAQCLGINGVGIVDWKFIDIQNVPFGPWKTIITK